jgi:hypothetical protein
MRAVSFCPVRHTRDEAQVVGCLRLLHSRLRRGHADVELDRDGTADGPFQCVCASRCYPASAVTRSSLIAFPSREITSVSPSIQASAAPSCPMTSLCSRPSASIDQ